MSRTLAASLLALALAPPSILSGEQLLPPHQEIAAVVDRYVDARLQKRDITPAPQADDANLLRRTMLDLVGRIPTAGEARAYLADQRSDKRIDLVDRLMASPAFVRHQANEFDAFLMAGTDRSIRDYLASALESGATWDQIFRDLLLIDDRVDPASPARQYLQARVRDLDKLTNDVSVMFFGVNVSCAKCHDHPLVPEWTQAHFYGMKSFFNRTFENGDFLGEHDYGVVSYKTTSGEERLADLMFLSGVVADEPAVEEPSNEEKKVEKQRLEELKKNKQPPPPPTFSRRAQLAEVALQPPDNQYFSQSIVNRIWYRLFGYGLVSPLDQMHPENVASHPELLAWLARDIVEHDYDLRRLIRGLVLSDAYARTSVWEGGDRPYRSYFAVANVRPLTPQQYATSLRLAVENPDRLQEAAPDERERRIESIENQARSLAQNFEQPREGFQVSVTEALLLNNNEAIQRDLLRASSDSLVGKLTTLDDPAELVETAVWNVFSRPAEDEERALLIEFVTSRPDDKTAVCQQLVWTLLTSSESRFTY